jgi:hypothetical protein
VGETKDSGQKEKLKDRFLKYIQERKRHVLWISVSIALIIALYFAYLEAISASRLDMLLPRGNVTTRPENGTTKITTIVPERIHPPFIPLFVILWGFIGSATYVLKVTTGHMSRKNFEDQNIPDHIVRLFIGTALAIIVYFVLSTGGFFWLTIDVTRIPNPNLIQYVYAVTAFF